MVDPCEDTQACSHRIRLSCHQTGMIMVALRQYASGRVGPALKDEANRLILRLTDRAPGNPGMAYGTCTYKKCERNGGDDPHPDWPDHDNPHRGPWRATQ